MVTDRNLLGNAVVRGGSLHLAHVRGHLVEPQIEIKQIQMTYSIKDGYWNFSKNSRSSTIRK